MKIGLIIYGTLDTLSGGYLYDRKLVEHLRAAGNTVQVFSLPWGNYPRHLLHNLTRPLISEIVASGLDLLLQDELNHPSLFAWNAALRRRVHIPLISVIHHLRSDERHPALPGQVYRWVERRYLRSVDAFVFNSHTTRDRVHTHLDGTPHGIVAYPAADHMQPPPATEIAASAARKYAPGRPLHVLFVGNIIERKGLHLLVRALARMPREIWRLDIAGSLSVAPGYVAVIRKAIQVAGISAQITLHGAVTITALKQLLTEADLLAVPSFEGFGIVYLEAMSYGLPVVATTAGAAHEIVSDGENGYLVPPHDVTALATVLANCAEDRRSLLALSRSARLRYDSHPKWNQSTESIRVWLHELM